MRSCAFSFVVNDQSSRGGRRVWLRESLGWTIRARLASVDKDMNSPVVTLLILGTIITASNPQPLTRRGSTYKGLPGLVPTQEILASGLNRAVYYHDQTVSIVDINRKNEIHDCYIVEGYEPRDIEETLKNLSALVRPMEVTFMHMIQLMHHCEQFDKMKWDAKVNSTGKDKVDKVNHIGINALNLLSGILPGTKWCGTGDIAENYHDIGPKLDVDRCCRTHDLCPVKIRAQRTRYNLTNYSLYSKSHCACDEALYHCLKEVENSTAKLLGTLYFNLVKVECVDDVLDKKEDSYIPRTKFSSTGLKF